MSETDPEIIETAQRPDSGDVWRAYVALESNQTRHARFFLRRAFGEPTEYEAVGGHIFQRRDRDHNEGITKECAGIGCELIQGTDDFETTKRQARAHECPVPLEVLSEE